MRPKKTLEVFIVFGKEALRISINQNGSIISLKLTLPNSQNIALQALAQTNHLPVQKQSRRNNLWLQELSRLRDSSFCIFIRKKHLMIAILIFFLSRWHLDELFVYGLRNVRFQVLGRRSVFDVNVTWLMRWHLCLWLLTWRSEVGILKLRDGEYVYLKSWCHLMEKLYAKKRSWKKAASRVVPFQLLEWQSSEELGVWSFLGRIFAIPKFYKSGQTFSSC